MEDADHEWNVYWRRWCGVPGVGIAVMSALLQRFQHPRLAWQAREGALAAVPGIGAKLLREITDRRRQGEEMEAAWERAGIQLVTPFDGAYPPLLRSFPGAPLGLFVKGRLDLPAPAVAVVGTRKASPYGLEVARWLGRSLAGRGIPVISGLALGIDGAVHRAVVEAGGITHAVLAHGLHTVAPARHRQLARAVTRLGALVSELPPGVEPRPWLFPVRNRIIAGLAHATVVVEAGQPSGALITAQSALEAGRDVYAVPGSIFSQTSQGTHALIVDGAVPLVEMGQLLTELGDGAQGDAQASGKDRQETGRQAVNGQDPQHKVLAQFASEALSFDQLHRQTGLLQQDLAAALTRLEVAGAIRSLPGGRYVRARVQAAEKRQERGL